MSTAIKNVALIGASGNVGPSILNQLVKDSFNVTVIKRESSNSTFPSTVKVVETDYSYDQLVTIFQGQDAVVSTIATPEIAVQKSIVDAAADAGVKRFIPSDFGSDRTNAGFLSIVPFMQSKVDIETHLNSKKDKGLTWTAVIAGPFFDWGLHAGFLGVDLANKSVTLFDGGNVPFTTSTLAQVGKGVAAVLKRPDLTANQNVFISSATLTQKDILATIEKVTGENWPTKDVTSKQLIDAGHAKIKEGDFSGIYALLQAGIFGEFQYGDHRANLWDSKLGLEQESAEEVLTPILQSK